MRTSLAAYLPEHLTRAGAALPEPPHASRRPGVLLLSDIAGFTALTERLAARGRRGAEEVARAVNAVFRPAIDAIEAHGGSVVAFGGDALLSMFATVRSARAAAESVERIAAGARGTGEPLRLTQAVHAGVLREMHLGTMRRRHYVLAGAAVRRLAILHAAAPRGAITISRSAAAAPALPRERAAARRDRRGGWRAFVPPRLLPHLGTTPGGFRAAAVLFLETRGESLPELQRFFLRLDALLERHDGTLLKSDASATGTKWMCVFGVPSAHEDALERAGRVALALLPSPVVRGGLHGGVVAMIEIGTTTRRSFDVMGDAVNTAARAAAAAAWGEVVVTEPSRRQATALLTTPRGSRAVKGKSLPLELHALAGVAAASTHAFPSRPLVGRRLEMGLLRRALARARAGGGSAFAILGEAGMGKSRLKWEVVASAGGLAVHEGRAVSFAGMPYWVVAEMLRNVLALGEGEAPARVREAVDAEARRLGLGDADVSLLVHVLGVAAPAGAAGATVDARARRQSTIVAVGELLARRCRERPHLLVLEDLHWADELSREVVDLLARRARTLPLVLLLLARPSYEAPAATRTLRLRELPRRDAVRLLSAVMPRRHAALPDLVQRAEGNPLFLEELAHHVTAAASPGGDGMPDSLEAVLEARLDRLPVAARRTAELASVIGRSFMRDLLVAIQGPAAVEGLGELAAADLLIERATLEAGTAAPEAPRVEHAFRHALVRDVAYASILVKRREALHRAVARAIERVLASDPGTYLPLRAHHWDAGGRPLLARPLYLAAARRASSVHALAEAEALYGRHLALGDGDRDALSARIELAGAVLFRLGRYADAIAEGARARNLAARLGDGAAQGRAEKHLGDAARILGRMDEAREHYGRALALAERVADRRLQAMALSGLGVLHAEQGRLAEALPLLERAVALQEAEADLLGQASASGNLGNLQVMAGQLDAAGATLEAACALFARAGDERSAAMAAGNLAYLRSLQGRTGEARQHLAGALAVLRRIGDRPAEAYALCQSAVLDVATGDLAGGRALLEQALAIHHAAGDRRIEAATCLELAKLRRRLGHHRAARRLLDGALDLATAVGDRGGIAGILSERAELLDAMGLSGSAELRAEARTLVAPVAPAGAPRG